MRELLRAVLERIGKRRVARVYRLFEQTCGILGGALVKVMPGRVRRLEEQDFSIFVGGGNPIDFLLRARMARKALADSDDVAIQRYHTRFWASSAGGAFHENSRGAHKSYTLPHYGPLIESVGA